MGGDVQWELDYEYWKSDQFLNKDYVYKMNSPYGCLLSTDYKIQKCFDTVYHVLRGE